MFTHVCGSMNKPSSALMHANMVGHAVAAQLLHDRTDTCSVTVVITPLRADHRFVLQCMQEGPMTPPGVPWSCGLLTAPQGQPALCSRTSTQSLMSKRTDLLPASAAAHVVWCWHARIACLACTAAVVLSEAVLSVSLAQCCRPMWSLFCLKKWNGTEYQEWNVYLTAWFLLM